MKRILSILVLYLMVQSLFPSEIKKIKKKYRIVGEKVRILLSSKIVKIQTSLETLKNCFHH